MSNEKQRHSGSGLPHAGDVDRLSADVSCPCGGKAYLVETEGGGYGVAHTLPYCDAFNDMEPVAYMKFLKKRNEN